MRNLLLVFLITSRCFSQELIEDQYYSLNEGFYLTHRDFKSNLPSITFDQIINIEDFKFLHSSSLKITPPKKIIYTVDGTEHQINPIGLWGMSAFNTLYIFQGKDFYKVQYMGAIIKFMYLDEKVRDEHGTFSKVPTPYFIDFTTGKLIYKLSEFEEIFSRDPKIYNEFMEIKKGKRNSLLEVFIVKYNNNNPIEFD